MAVEARIRVFDAKRIRFLKGSSFGGACRRSAILLTIMILFVLLDLHRIALVQNP